MDASALRSLIEDANILTDLQEESGSSLKKKGLDFGYSGKCLVEGKEINMLIGFSKHFPRHKPGYFFTNWKDYDYIPHIEKNDAICYTRDENLVLDMNNPAGILHETFQKVKETLGDGFTGKNRDDFLNEFESYWNQLAGVTPIYANVELSQKVEIIKVGKKKSDNDNSTTWFAVSDTAERVNSIERFISFKNSPPLVNAIYIPLEKYSLKSIPHPDKGLTFDFVRELIFENISEKNKRLLITALSKYNRLEETIIVGMPQPNGNTALFGVRINGGGVEHPLVEKNSNAKIKPLLVQRLDKEYMLTRGGNGLHFTDKHILLIGGGAVGGFIADELVRSTFLHIDIIDKDDLRIENCYRHVCGYTYLHKNKAEALKLRLQEHFPHSNIEAMPELIEDLVAKRKIDWTKYDAVLVATGNATINMYLAEFFKVQRLKIPLFFSWLDPYGIGGHCLVTNITPKGCYCCLYFNERLFLKNKASFAAPDQPKPFLKTVAGCGGVYSPYAGADASQTAILTVRKVISYFNGKEASNAIYSWKGSPDQFIAEGFTTSNRFGQSAENLEENKTKFIEEKCDNCGD